jgi:hypothetical protein
LHEEFLDAGGDDRVGKQGSGPRKLRKEELTQTAKARPGAVSTVYDLVEVKVADIGLMEQERRVSTHKTNGKPNIEPGAPIAGMERGLGIGVKDGGAFLVQLGRLSISRLA